MKDSPKGSELLVSIYLLGPLIKQRREALGYTQEELADGICSVPTLSRIENGERIPTKHHSEMLLQRLGYSDSVQVSFVTEKTLEMHELKYRIRQAVIHHNNDQALILLNQFILLADRSDCISEQFIQLHQTILSSLSNEDKIERLTRAIRLTCPKYNPAVIPDFLSYEEIIIINNIAVCYGDDGRLDEAIQLLKALKRHHESRMVNQEEILRTQLLILYNLSKYLGQAQRFDECIEICDQGIRISQETRRCNNLDRFYYNKAWSLLRRNRTHDIPIAKECIRLAICTADALGRTALKQHFIEFMHSNFLS